MRARLRQLGWQEIEVVDEDLGRSAAGTVTRTGFERMVSEVCLGHVGAVAAREVSRFARNSRDWQQLVEVCRIVDTVLIDQETVYAPRLSNDRLLLGLKGSLNEYELDLLRQRSVEARVEKARRGELIPAAPVGYLKTEDQKLEKNPDQRIQQAIQLVFSKFSELGTVRQTLLWFLEHGLQVPTQTARGEVLWRRPAYRAMYRILTQPVYGGAYAYGKTEQVLRYEKGEARYGCRRKPRDQWLALIPDAHEGYVSWEEFERLQKIIHDNTPGLIGAAKKGPSMLAGILRCRRCGRKLTVRYTGNRHNVLRYTCNRGWLDNGEARCIAFGGIPVDEAIAREVLRVVQPAAIEAAIQASQQEARLRDQVLEALRRDLEAAQYAAQRTQRQFDAADPENRLVTGELERRWNVALTQVREIELKIATHQGGVAAHRPAIEEEFVDLARDLESVWQDAGTDTRLKKRIVRTLIEEVIVDVDSAAGEIILIIHWKGGVHTELRLPRRRRGQNNAQSPKELIQSVASLALICSDDLIAGILNRNGMRTGRGNRWTRERVTALRSHHNIPVYDAQKCRVDGWMNLTGAAAFLGVSPRTLRLAVDRGEIAAEHPLPDGPWIFEKAALETDASIRFVRRIRRERPALPQDRQPELDFTTT
jgi:DNA invertase Pin-like site-specific DNA recombinase